MSDLAWLRLGIASACACTLLAGFLIGWHFGMRVGVFCLLRETCAGKMPDVERLVDDARRRRKGGEA